MVCYTYRKDDKELTINVCYSWEMALIIASTLHSITCRTGKECDRKQEKSIVQKLIYQMIRLYTVKNALEILWIRTWSTPFQNLVIRVNRGGWD